LIAIVEFVRVARLVVFRFGAIRAVLTGVLGTAFFVAATVRFGFGAVFFGAGLEVVRVLGLLKIPLLLPKSCPKAKSGIRQKINPKQKNRKFLII